MIVRLAPRESPVQTVEDGLVFPVLFARTVHAVKDPAIGNPVFAVNQLALTIAPHLHGFGSFEVGNRDLADVGDHRNLLSCVKCNRGCERVKHLLSG